MSSDDLYESVDEILLGSGDADIVIQSLPSLASA
jgi:hypothetical protein